MCCFALILGFFGPRFGILVWYLADPTRWSMSFSTWVWPLLGSLFAPWTTLMYVAVAPGGVQGSNWFWIVLGILLDLASHAAAGRKSSERVSAGR